MDKEDFTSFKIEDRSYVSIAKREILKLLKKNSFNETVIGEINIIVSELCSNLIKHTNQGGDLLCRIAEGSNKKTYFEIYSLDNGPGTNDIQRMAKDGNSSSNTLGQGLGAITRLSDFFQIYSMKGWGTIAYSKKYREELSLQNQKSKPMVDVRVLQEAISGEVVCGDGYSIKNLPDETQIFLGDGLGHGQHANDAINEAITAFQYCNENSPVHILKYIHEKVKKTRGLVGSVAIINHLEKKWRIAGIGNISTRLYQGLEYKSYMPYNGILGLNILNSMKDNIIDADRFQSIIMCSDGIKTKWDIAKYTSLLKYNPAIMAAAIFKDNARHTDDMSVLVGKLNF